MCHFIKKEIFFLQFIIISKEYSKKSILFLLKFLFIKNNWLILYLLAMFYLKIKKKSFIIWQKIIKNHSNFINIPRAMDVLNRRWFYECSFVSFEIYWENNKKKGKFLRGNAIFLHFHEKIVETFLFPIWFNIKLVPQTWIHDEQKIKSNSLFFFILFNLKFLLNICAFVSDIRNKWISSIYHLFGGQGRQDSPSKIRTCVIVIPRKRRCSLNVASKWQVYN